jgi:hypothetical protein
MKNLGGNVVQTCENVINPSVNAVLKGSIPAWANSKNLVGAADPGGDVGFRVYLGWSNDSAVQALASAVSDAAALRTANS